MEGEGWGRMKHPPPPSLKLKLDRNKDAALPVGILRWAGEGGVQVCLLGSLPQRVFVAHGLKLVF